MQFHISNLNTCLIGDNHLHVATSKKKKKKKKKGRIRRRRKSWAYPMFGCKEIEGREKVANIMY